MHYYTSAEGAAEVVAAVQAMGRQAIAEQADLTRADQVRRVVAAAEQRWGRIDILVNNAGDFVGRHALAEITETFFHQVIDVNVLTTFLCCQAVAPGMVARAAAPSSTCRRWRRTPVVVRACRCTRRLRLR